MNFNKHSLLAISLAAMLSLSVIAIAGLPQADADKGKFSEKKFWQKFVKFFKKPDFQSKDCILTPFASNLPGDADCEMQAWLNKKGTALDYKIKITGMEALDINNNVDDDIDGSHIHENTLGTDANPKGPHVLDAFGNPQFEDVDVVVVASNGGATISGYWTDADDASGGGDHRLTPYIQSLCDGKIFSAVHGQVEDEPDHKAPYLKMLLEPTKSGDRTCKKLGY